jgi:hypothetical protein
MCGNFLVIKSRLNEFGFFIKGLKIKYFPFPIMVLLAKRVVSYKYSMLTAIIKGFLDEQPFFCD